MKIKCIETNSTGIDRNEVHTISAYPFDFSNYGLNVNDTYEVMAFILYKNTKYLYYLIDINGKPYWFPNELFEVIDNSIPGHWFFKNFTNEQEVDIYCIWGYDEICNDDNHYDALIERDSEALKIYFQQKARITKYCEED